MVVVPVEVLTVRVVLLPMMREVAAPETLARSWSNPETSSVVPAPSVTAEASRKAASVFTMRVPPVRFTAPVIESGTSRVSVPAPVFSKLPAPTMSPCWKATAPPKGLVVAALNVTVLVAASSATIVPSRPAIPVTVLSNTRIPRRSPSTVGTVKVVPAVI